MQPSCTTAPKKHAPASNSIETPLGPGKKKRRFDIKAQPQEVYVMTRQTFFKTFKYLFCYKPGPVSLIETEEPELLADPNADHP